MSRWTYTPIVPGDTRDVATVKAILDGLATASTSLDARNFAEEGLSAAAFAARPWSGQARLSRTVRTAVAVSAAFIQFNPGLAFRTGAMPALGANDALRVRTWAFFSTTNGGGAGVPISQTIGMRHVWNNGAATAKITASEVRRTQGPGVATTMLHAALFSESWLVGPITTIAWIELQYLLSGATAANCARCNMNVDLITNMQTG